jgi:hypothetical protein
MQAFELNAGVVNPGLEHSGSTWEKYRQILFKEFGNDA